MTEHTPAVDVAGSAVAGLGFGDVTAAYALVVVELEQNPKGWSEPVPLTTGHPLGHER